MKDYTALRRQVEDFISEKFTTVPLVYTNDPLDKSLKEFINVDVELDDSKYLEIGNTAQVIDGSVVITINTPLNTGTVRSSEIASLLSESVVGASIADVFFTESELYDVSLTEESIFFQQKLVIPYISAVGTL